LLLLDTNHCFRVIAPDQRLLDRLERIGSEAIVTSVIVAGELYYGASISKRVSENRSAVSRFLRAIDVVPVSSAMADEYGRLKAALLERFGPRERVRRRDFDLAKLGFGDNDFWIAAAALDRGAVLVSADPDFARMADVVDLDIEDWTRS
jgi:tRNA(fMet)-specific endonuclease VapC